ncbi:MAG: zinc-binding dehydrogenase [Caldilineaceae bacterium]
MNIARELGAKHIVLLNLKRNNAVEKVGKLTDGKMCDVVFEVMGRQEPLLIATEVTKAGGQLILAATHEGGLRQVNLALWSERSLDIVSTHQNDPELLREGLRLRPRRGR